MRAVVLITRIYNRFSLHVILKFKFNLRSSAVLTGSDVNVMNCAQVIIYKEHSRNDVGIFRCNLCHELRSSDCSAFEHLTLNYRFKWIVSYLLD